MKKFPIVLTLCALTSVTISGCGCSETPTTIFYTVTFKNYDGSLLSESKVKRGESVTYNGQNPYRANTSEFTYTFSGWDQSLENILSDCTRYAQFTETAIPVTHYYTVSFKNYDGTLLYDDYVVEGGTATYGGEAPTRPETSEYLYTFSGWDYSLENITSNCTRIAQYSATQKQTVKYYTVTFMNYDGTVLTTDVVVEGGTAHYEGTPIRHETEEYTYTFSGWDKPLTNITSDCVRVAQFTETAKQVTKLYTVTFLNYDGTVLTTDQVEFGGTASYGVSDPIRPETTEYSYTFSGWDKPLTNITADCVRIAQYTETAKEIINHYLVTFKNYDGTILDEVVVVEGGNATYGGQTPTRPATSEFTYTFTGWDKPLTNITSDRICVAQYSNTYIEYTVRFLDYEGQPLYEDIVHYQESATYYGETPTKPASGTHHYTFKGWDKDITCITKSIEVNPLFNEIGDDKHVDVRPNNGESDSEIEVTFGEHYNLGTPTFPCFTFAGWYYDDTLIPTSGTWNYPGVGSVTARWTNTYFVFTENGENSYSVALTEIGKASTEIVIPSWYEGRTITALGENFAYQDTAIEKVTIPGTIKNIPQNSFYYCTKLKEANFNEGLLTIGSQAFDGCKLEKVTIPSTCTTINSRAFDDNSSLYHIYIPESVTSIGSYAFDVINSAAYVCVEKDSVSGYTSSWIKSSTAYYTSCTKLVEGDDYNYVIRDVHGDISVTVLRLSKATSKLHEFTFPSEIEEIPVVKVGKGLFQNNLDIRNVDLTGVTRINDYAFYGCTNLNSVTFSDKLTYIGSAAFASCSGLNNVTFPNSLTYIGGSAFRYCTSLTRVEIPSSVTEIATLAFDACSNLEYIYVPKTVTTIGTYAFDDCPKATIYSDAHGTNGGWSSSWKGSQSYYYDFVSLGKTEDFNYVVQYYAEHFYVTITSMKNSAKEKLSITLPDTIEDISDIRLKDSLFVGFNNLVTVDVGLGVSKIPDHCFDGCSKLETVVLHEGLTSIGFEAFDNCQKLSSINMPHTLTTIGSYAFDYCYSLREIVIPQSVTTINQYAFRYSRQMAILVEASNDQQSGWSQNWAYFTDTKQFIYDYKSSGVIGDFRYAKKTLNNVNTICILGLTEGNTNVDLVVPDQIEGITDIRIARIAFANNEAIKTVDLGNSVTAIGANAFKGDISLSSVIIPASCTTINEYAFQNCKTTCVLNCEAASKPDGWNSNWNYSNCQVVWGYVRP